MAFFPRRLATLLRQHPLTEHHLRRVVGNSVLPIIWHIVCTQTGSLLQPGKLQIVEPVAVEVISGRTTIARSPSARSTSQQVKAAPPATANPLQSSGCCLRIPIRPAPTSRSIGTNARPPAKKARPLPSPEAYCERMLKLNFRVSFTVIVPPATEGGLME